MKENDLIGLAGVFVLTIFLLLLYHLMSSIGRHTERSNTQTKPPNNPDRHRRENFDLHKDSADDDAWLLWSPELDQAGSANRVCDGLA